MNLVIQCIFIALLHIVSGQGGVIVGKDMSREPVNGLATKPFSFQQVRSTGQYASIVTVNPYNTTCQDSRDCTNIDVAMYCFKNVCHCKQDYVYIYNLNKKCFRKAGWEEECIYNLQCRSTRNSVCRSGICSCSVGYFYNGLICSPRPSPRSKATEVYTAALVAISCIMVAVTCILVGCVVKKSSQLRNYQNRPSQHSRGSDVFTIAEEIAAVRAADKPPTYDEVMRNEQIQFGIPPPDYPSSSSTTISEFPSSSSTISLSYASPVPGPSHLFLRGTSPNQVCDAEVLPSTPSVHELSDSSCSSESLTQRTNDITSETSNGTVELETNSNSHTQIVPSPLSSARQQSRVNASSATDGELGAYANLAFSLDV